MIDSMLLNPDSLIIVSKFSESPFKIESSDLPCGFTVYSNGFGVSKITYTNKFGITSELNYSQMSKICNYKDWDIEEPIYKGYAWMLFPNLDTSDEDWIDNFVYNLSKLDSEGIIVKNATLNLDVLKISHKTFNE